jgi:hypothetical protein
VQSLKEQPLSLFGASLILASHSIQQMNQIAVVAGGHRARKFRRACDRSGSGLFRRSGGTWLFSDLKVGRDAATGLANHTVIGFTVALRRAVMIVTIGPNG